MKVTKEQAFHELAEKWWNSEDLRTQYQQYNDLLRGDFEVWHPDDTVIFNEHPHGAFVSRKLIQGAKPEPTVGIVFPGAYHIDLKKGNRENFLILEGMLRASVNSGPWSILRPGSSVIAEPGNAINLAVPHLVYYFCEYVDRRQAQTK